MLFEFSIPLGLLCTYPWRDSRKLGEWLTNNPALQTNEFNSPALWTPVSR